MKFTFLAVLFCYVSIQGRSQETLQSVTNNGNTTTNRVAIGSSDDGISQLQLKGKITLNSGIKNMADRPPIVAGTANYEIRSRSSDGYALDDGFLRISAGGGTHSKEKSYIDICGYSTKGDMHSNLVFGTKGTERMRVDLSGNVGIGTKHPDARLAVNGAIHAQQIKVNLSGWPDYVFDSSYHVSSLQALEGFIKQYKHLPGIPDQNQVGQDGVDLGDMDTKLLQKIEELTLHMIEMDKRVRELEKENKLLKNRLIPKNP